MINLSPQGKTARLTELDRRLRALNDVLRSHGGGVRLVSEADGRLIVGLTGVCTSCMVKAITAETLVVPVLETLPGVVEVEVAGVRVSSAVKQRLASYKNERLIHAIAGDHE